MSGRFQWTDADTQKLISFRRSGLDNQEIANRFSVPIRRIDAKIRALIKDGSVTFSKLRWTPELDARLSDLQMQGVQHKKIAEMLGVHVTAVASRASRLIRRGICVPKPNRVWTPEATATLVTLRDEGLSQRQIASAMGTTEKAVGSQIQGLVREGLLSKAAARFTPEETDRIINLRHEGKTLQEIASLIGCGKEEARWHVVCLRKAGRISAKVTWPEERVQRLICLHSEGRTHAEVAREIGCTPKAVERQVSIYKKGHHFRLNHAVASKIARSLRESKGGRRWETLVGYKLPDLMAHLQRQFKKGMSWDNYGSKWHVDHIRPRSSFLFESHEDAAFADCWALSNLRPLATKANLSKGSKREFLL